MTLIAEFFDDLGRRGYEPLLGRVSATVRFDIVNGEETERRLARIDHGDIRVSEENAPADCVLVGSRAVFDAIVGGRTNAMASLLRGVLAVDGDPELLVLIQRLFAGPQASPADGSSGRDSVAGGRRSS